MYNYFQHLDIPRLTASRQKFHCDNFIASSIYFLSSSIIYDIFCRVVYMSDLILFPIRLLGLSQMCQLIVSTGNSRGKIWKFKSNIFYLTLSWAPFHFVRKVSIHNCITILHYLCILIFWEGWLLIYYNVFSSFNVCLNGCCNIVGLGSAVIERNLYIINLLLIFLLKLAWEIKRSFIHTYGHDFLKLGCNHRIMCSTALASGRFFV